MHQHFSSCFDIRVHPVFLPKLSVDFFRVHADAIGTESGRYRVRWLHFCRVIKPRRCNGARSPPLGDFPLRERVFTVVKFFFFVRGGDDIGLVFGH
jgi:hypothetical protein